MPKSSEYWQKRFEQLEEAQLNKGAAYYANLDKQFNKAQKTIQAKIEAWYGRLALNNEVSLLDAKRMLNKNELEEFKWSVEEYIERGKENAVSQQWMKQLENASAKMHISRLEAQKLHIQNECEILFGNMDDGLNSTMKDIYKNGYYRSAYEIQKGFEVGWSVNQLDEKRIANVLTQSWAPDGSNFSERIWKSKSKLINELNTSLTQSLIRGDAPDKAVKTLADKMHVSKRAAGNLVMTESAYFASASQKSAFTDLGVEQYEVVATLDSHTSSICRELDGKVFFMKDYVVGETAPPFHGRCRSCTAPYFSDEFTIDDKRVARDNDGNSYYVPADMNYKKWHEKYVENNLEESLKEKKNLNMTKDSSQFTRYIKALGLENVPLNLDEFQNTKYCNEIEYGILKVQYSGMQYYESCVSNEPLITSTLHKLAKDSNSILLGLEHRIKEKKSYLDKIRINYAPGANHYEINDILRYTFEADAEKTLEIIDSLRDMGYNTIRVKNTWLDRGNPYKGINTIVQAPNGKKFELQYHTNDSFKVKEEIHAMYEKWRKLDKSSSEAIELAKKMSQKSSALVKPKNIEKVGI